LDLNKGHSIHYAHSYMYTHRILYASVLIMSSVLCFLGQQMWKYCLVYAKKFIEDINFCLLPRTAKIYYVCMCVWNKCA